MMKAHARLVDMLARWESRGLPIAVGRCLVGVATLLSITFTPDSGLVGTSADLAADGHCDGIGSISLWCVSDSVSGGLLAARVLSICVLAVAISGYRPQWTCVPQWYVTFSFGSSVLVQQGGDGVAKVATLLLIPLCLGDPRAWQWQRPNDLVSPKWRGAACAAHLVLRLQVLVIYATAAVSKLTDSAWLHGTAIYFVANNPTNGFPPSLRAIVGPLLGSYPLVAALSWSVIGIESVIALTIIGSPRARLIALLSSVVLHVGIGVLMSLPAFSLTMIGLTLSAYGGRLVPTPNPTDGADHQPVVNASWKPSLEGANVRGR
jgi:antimicrobial peptide system SdpB family protein